MRRTKAKRYANKHIRKTIKTDKIKKNVSESNLSVSFDKILDSNSNDNANKNNITNQYNFEEPKKEKSGKLKKVILNFLIVIFAIAIIFSLYNIILWFLDNKNSKDMISNIYDSTSIYEEQTNIDDKTVTKRSYDFTNLIEKNPDTVGWIYVKGTNIDYPVVQAANNDYYLTHSFDKSNNSAGWVFADYRSNLKILNYNTILYGHNRKDQSMFGSLKNVLDENWRNTDENLYINFATLNENHIYKVFSVFVCDDKDVAGYTRTSFSGNDEFSSYVNQLKKLSSYNFETDVSTTSQIITLYTCYGLNNQRLLVCATLVE